MPLLLLRMLVPLVVMACAVPALAQKAEVARSPMLERSNSDPLCHHPVTLAHYR
jgi:hypothetical protein